MRRYANYSLHGGNIKFKAYHRICYPGCIITISYGRKYLGGGVKISLHTYCCILGAGHTCDIRYESRVLLICKYLVELKRRNIARTTTSRYGAGCTVSRV